MKIHDEKKAELLTCASKIYIRAMFKDSQPLRMYEMSTAKDTKCKLVQNS
jgi:hypothetical protein